MFLQRVQQHLCQQVHEPLLAADTQPPVLQPLRIHPAAETGHHLPRPIILLFQHHLPAQPLHFLSHLLPFPDGRIRHLFRQSAIHPRKLVPAGQPPGIVQHSLMQN